MAAADIGVRLSLSRCLPFSTLQCRSNILGCSFGACQRAAILPDIKLDVVETSLISLPATPRHVRTTLAVSALMLAGLVALAPFAQKQLAKVDAFIPSFEATIFVTDFITSVLLFSQFSVHRTRALLVLASGYLFSALIVIPHALTFPGAFSPEGLLGAGLQTTAWLYWFWHIGFPLALFLYACLNEGKRPNRSMISASSAITRSAAIVVGVVCGLTVLATAGNEFTPRLSLDRTHLQPLNHDLGMVSTVICLAAIAALWVRRRSVLDQWLLVVAVAALSELVLAVALVNSRYSLGFYAGRAFSLATSTLVLVALLAETIRTQSRLMSANVLLQRERRNKLMNMEAMVASLSHELRQPLGALALNTETALQILEAASPDLEELRSIATDVNRDSQRVSQTLVSFGSLFGSAAPRREPLDLNAVVEEALRGLRRRGTPDEIIMQIELTPDLPMILGDGGQLHEMMINLVQNAIEALATVNNDPRLLRVSTGRDRDAIVLTVEDTGPGIDPSKIGAIFDAFVTTKPRGMGLGLAICRMIAERHNGAISAAPVDPHGSSFRVILPTG
jgi:signal transduction histidine kinase